MNSKTEASQVLPDKIGSFRARAQTVEPSLGTSELFAPGNFEVVSQATRLYSSLEGDIFAVEVFSTRSYSGAYALLTTYGWGNQEIKRRVIGTAAILEPRRVSFFKGTNFVRISQTSPAKGSQEKLLAFARMLADSIEGGDNDIPVLVRHLPAWESVQERTFYAISSNSLKQAISNQPIINDLTFDGGTEAALAYYGIPKLLLVEFNTPQIAGENDLRITARIQELRNQGQPAPTAYRRVGNYSVFVFDAPSELAANQLIDKVKYQQVVQWLGENPYSYREAVAEFTQTTLGVLVSVVKASGLVLLGSLAIGGFFGALLFTRRRAQQQARGAYSDAGGMLQLNLDEINPKTDSARILGPGN
ncbi:MAG: hypothetical protein M3R52_10090 [Acidobacteriota bacterium]|nr:hypothetical protein [Acidobacteriota bacterium]